MREYITSDDICNQILMNRSVFKGTVLVIEGNTDYRLYSKFTDEDVKVIPAHSKDNVKSVIRKMTSRKDGRVVAIVDRDLDDLKGKKVSPPIFYTDYRDMEMILVNSTALDEVLVEFADADKLRRFTEYVSDLRDAVVSGSYPLGLLMYVSYLRGYNLNFKDLDFESFIDKKNLSCDVKKMAIDVVSNTTNCRARASSLVADLKEQAKKCTEKRKIARGHDTVKVLLIALKYAVGSYNARQLNDNALSGSLRIAYDLADFQKTDLYKVSEEWTRSRGITLWKVN